MSSMYEPIGWARRPDGGKVFQHTKRHLRDPNVNAANARTLCGILIPRRALQDDSRGVLFASVFRLDLGELAQEDPCVRCYTRAGLPVLAAAERARLAAEADGRRAYADSLFEAEGLRR